jgi:Zn-dependent protease with chaperone function
MSSDFQTSGPPDFRTLGRVSLMDFFARQDDARASSRRLVIFFVFGVLAMLLVINLVTAVAVAAMHQHGAPLPVDLKVKIHLAVSVAMLAIVGLGSWYKVSELSVGGSAVAAMVGARPVDPGSHVPEERQLINVVEEMAIASGVPMPGVYLLDEDGINAFAAGYTTRDAVVAVTRGCMVRLTRDELQGVVAHEFSHILNGDMRLNTRLIGMVHGIILIALLGEILFRSAQLSGYSSSRDRQSNGLPLLLLGLALMVIGSLGALCGKLIKAAVSRQREFLADASAVQFTRNPAGIGGALKKIGGSYELAFVQNQRASEVSHLFLGRAQARPVFGWFDTHPPIAERIHAIDPQWDGEFLPSAPVRIGDRVTATERRLGPPGGERAAWPTQDDAIPALTKMGGGMRPAEVVASIGTVSPDQVAFGTELLTRLPTALVTAAHDPFSARAAVLAVLVGQDATLTLPCLDDLDRVDPPLARELRRVLEQVRELSPGVRLPVIDLAASSLGRMTPAQARTFLGTLDRATAAAPLPVQLLAFLVRRHLEPGPVKPGSVRNLGALLPHAEILLSALAHAGTSDQAVAQAAFTLAVDCLGAPRDRLTLLSSDAITAARLGAAIDQLVGAGPGHAKRLVESCAWCVASDGKVTLHEAELLRAVSVCLDCPMPPFADMDAD